MSEEKTASRLIEHEELRDIHRRIDSLKEEGERNHKELASQLHNLEVAVARGGRFPPAAIITALALVLSTVGTGSVLYAKLEVANANSVKALTLIEEHLKEAPTHRYNVERLGALVDDWNARIPVMDERVRSLEGRVVGQGPNGWHRSDHDNYATAVDARFKLLEERQDNICARVAACRGGK